MEVMLQPNAWSCLPTAAAMVMGVEPATIIDEIGHDGSEILWNEMPEPHNRRGFHLQEIIDVLAANLVLPVLIEASPRVYRCEEDQVGVEVFPDPTERLSEYLNNHLAILVGAYVNNPDSFHAVAWNRAECFDPRGTKYGIGDFLIEGALVMF